ncbi:MAG: MerR family transcriptional regulator, partial [Clostridia bacterium]|nr:MerR family transcriptional regulator [Clostridia bacterium]
MKMNVSEFAKLTGVSVRTLHYYDEIGLLKPDFVDDNTGYRFYGEKAFSTMQEILFYRELDFSLKSIKEFITSPSHNKSEALKAQKQLLILKKQRLERIIEAISSAEKGDKIMNFDAFNNSEINKYKDEVKMRFGSTEAYRQSQEKTANYTENDWNNFEQALNQIIGEFAKAKDDDIK